MESTPNITAASPFLAWRQGDCVIGTEDFVFRILPASPLSMASHQAVKVDPQAEFVVEQVDGLMVISQGCDIVRNPTERPFIEVAPLVHLPEGTFNEVLLGARPQFVTVPGLHANRLAADLDRIQTVEKSLLAGWQRLSGCLLDADRRSLGKQLARKRYRAALPDEFAPWFKPLRNRFARLKDSSALDASVFHVLEEIRIQASPSWDAPQIDVFIWFILDDEASIRDRSSILDAWLAKIPPSGPFVTCLGRFVRYEEMTAAEYIDSDPLDLDHLSPEMGE